jgi:hypothetical protein
MSKKTQQKDAELLAPLRAARREAGLTLNQLVAILEKNGVNTSPAWISRIERGNDCMCSPQLAESIAQVFGDRKIPLTEIQIIYPHRFKQGIQARRRA